MEKVALFVHLLGVLIFVGGVAVAGVAFEAARRRSGALEVVALLRSARLGAVLVAAGGLLLLAGGLWLVGVVDDVGFGTGWLDAALALFVAAAVIGGLAGQRPKQARLAAERLAERGGEVDADLRRRLDDPFSRAANYVSACLVLAILALMVFKP